MSTPVVMPQMGESIAEGTIVRWIKKVGDAVDRDEPLFEISTDKVDAEIPSPAAGVAARDLGQGRRDGAGQQRRRHDRRGGARPVRRRAAATGARRRPLRHAGAAGRRNCPAPPHRPTAIGRRAAPSAPTGGRHRRRGLRHLRICALAAPAPTADDRCPAESSPLVRRIAKEHSVDSAQITGSGIAGRVTKQDILGYIEQPAPAAPPPPRRIRAPAPPHLRTRHRDPFRPGDRPRRADVGDAQEDRRAHGAQQAHVGARVLGVRSQLQPGRRDSQGEEGRVRAARASS